MKKLLVLLFASLLSTGTVFADVSFEAPLDPPYPEIHPKIIPSLKGRDIESRNDVNAVIAQQTPVKSQMQRGTCSIFSATAYLEAMLVRNGFSAMNLSEEWLQYLIAQDAFGEGSTSPNNFEAMQKYGQPREELYPYIGVSWKTVNDPGAEICQNVQDIGRCLIGHGDTAWLNMSAAELRSVNPTFLEARREASQNQKAFFQGLDINLGNESWINSAQTVKTLLDAGVPVTLDIRMYYGSWNHRLANELGIGLDSDEWMRGEVGYPEVNSEDYRRSNEKPAGHSILVVGYDDSKVLTYKLKVRENGRLVDKTFSRRGVYFFKNSWGTYPFGSEFTPDGVNNYPGYGMISQDYAEEYGQFYQLKMHNLEL